MFHNTDPTLSSRELILFFEVDVSRLPLRSRFPLEGILVFEALIPFSKTPFVLEVLFYTREVF